mmetsp:Transcript_98202/g.225409  ORF Transcript_98202/g.225409 Transcript_98202/m.225409 type:complete len:203 (+) Transcript_98202:870-1478(+)
MCNHWAVLPAHIVPRRRHRPEGQPGQFGGAERLVRVCDGGGADPPAGVASVPAGGGAWGVDDSFVDAVCEWMGYDSAACGRGGDVNPPDAQVLFFGIPCDPSVYGGCLAGAPHCSRLEQLGGCRIAPGSTRLCFSGPLLGGGPHALDAAAVQRGGSRGTCQRRAVRGGCRVANSSGSAEADGVAVEAVPGGHVRAAVCAGDF